MKIYNLICESCGAKFTHNHENKKTCSQKCRNERNLNLNGRSVNTDLGISSGTVGAISELIICSDLMKKGYSVFRALSPACYCDAIAVKGTKIVHIEIRTCYRNLLTNNLQFPLKLSQNKLNKPDCYGLYERNSGEIMYLDMNKKNYDI